MTSANLWIDQQNGYVIGPDTCNVDYREGMWYLTVFVRNDNTLKQHFNHTIDSDLWNFGKNLFNTGFKQPVLGDGEVMHYFGSEKV